MGWQANHPVMATQVAGDRLTNPPVNVGRQCIPTLWIELFDAMGQTHVAFLNDVKHLCPASMGRVTLGDRDNQPEVAVDQLVVRPEPNLLLPGCRLFA